MPDTDGVAFSDVAGISSAVSYVELFGLTTTKKQLQDSWLSPCLEWFGVPEIGLACYQPS